MTKSKLKLRIAKLRRDIISATGPEHNAYYQVIELVEAFLKELEK